MQLAAHRAGDVGGEDDVGELVEQVVAGEDLGFGDVQDRVDPACGELGDESILVDDAASRGVDEGGSVPHPGQVGCAEQRGGLRSGRDVDGDHVAAGQQLGQLDLAGAERSDPRHVDTGVGDDEVEVAGQPKADHSAYHVPGDRELE